MAATTIQYQSYLLRLWPTKDSDKIRATLLSVHKPGEQHHFATLDDLTHFLNESVWLHSEDEADKRKADDSTDVDTDNEGSAGQVGGHRTHQSCHQ